MKLRNMRALVATTLLWLCTGVVARAQTSVTAEGEPPARPIPRIEAGMHTAKIGHIGIDAAGRYLVTGSHDKTVRVWSLTGKADYQHTGRITVNMLDLYLSERVKELTGGRQTPTTTKPQTVPDFPVATVRP